MEKKVRVLLVAVMGYGKAYLNGFKEGVENAVLEGIVDFQKDVLEEDPWIRENQIPVYRTLDEFYAEHRADLAVISTPIHQHMPYTMSCLKEGSSVLCEKPLCLKVEEALEMQAFAEKQGCFLAVGYQRCYNKDVLTLKKEILAGELGAPIRLRSYHGGRRGDSYYNRNSWAGKITADGREVFDSPFQNACAHEFQLATFFLGNRMDAGARIESVEAECYRGNPNIENYDTVALCAMTDRKVPIYFYTAHPVDEPWKDFGEYEFERATVHYGKNEERQEEFRICYKDGRERNLTKEVGPTPYLQKLYDAVEAVRKHSCPVCNIYCEIPHIEAVRMTQAFPIQVIDPERVEIIREADDTYYAIKGMTEKMKAAAENWTLPGKMGRPL